ncbi:MAG: hypothetical protein Q4C30_07780 [Bacteroidia bacterium]|nr:hypothetical protein [Bacteroidia bacterium]
MKHVFSIFLLAMLTIAASGQSARRDSLLNMGRSLRDARMFAEAIFSFTEAGGDAGRIEIAQTRFETGEFSKALEICNGLIDNESIFTDEAELLVARIRDAQGLHRIANMKYRKLVKANNAKASYYYALMKHRTGNNNEAVKLLQHSITHNRANIDAHIVLSEIMINNGQRYLAILPIMYSLILSTDTETIREYQPQLEALLSKSSIAVQQLYTKSLPYVTNNIQRTESMISYYIENTECPANEPHIIHILPQLLNYMQEHQTDNIDWWQIAYADFFSTLCQAGHQEALIHHLCSSLNPTVTRQWIESHEGQYAAFLTWLSFQH